MTSHDTSIRFIADLACESPAVQDAVQQMMQELRDDRVEEEARLAAVKAQAVAAAEHAIDAAGQQAPDTRLAS